MQAAPSQQESLAVSSNTSEIKSQGEQLNPTAAIPETEDSCVTKVLDPFMVYQVEDIIEFNKELAKTAKFSVKTCGKFHKVFPESKVDITSKKDERLLLFYKVELQL